MNVALWKICSAQKVTKLYYILTHDDRLPNCFSKWNETLNVNISWKHVFLKIHKIRYVKLRRLQKCILHTIIATNVTLKVIGVVDDTRHFCNNDCLFIEGL